MKPEKFSIKKRIRSFSFAFNGLKLLIRNEHNARIHLIVGFVVLISGFLLRISIYDWVAVAFAVGLVITLELINSSIEHIADFISPEKHASIKAIKDLSAAGVLIGAITAIIIGLIVFIPKIYVLGQNYLKK